MRIGIGYDIHKLVSGRRLILGGIEIPYEKGLEGHSDADVLLHAVSDALLGAISEADIGQHFPDTDPQYKGVSSVELLKKVYALVQSKDYRINNIDTVIIAQGPKLTPFKERIQKQIAHVLNIEEDKVNIKAKTNEGLGDLGKNKAIATYAVVLITKKSRED